MLLGGMGAFLPWNLSASFSSDVAVQVRPTRGLLLVWPKGFLLLEMKA